MMIALFLGLVMSSQGVFAATSTLDSSSNHSFDQTFSFEIGNIFARGVYVDTPPTEMRYYGIIKDKAVLDLGSGSTLTLLGEGRGWYDTKNPNDADIRELSLALASGNFKTTAGYQQITWGETFGVYVTDLVNPRDYTDPLFNELDWIKIPVLCWNTQLFLGPLTLQAIVTPVPRNNVFPTTGSTFDTLTPNVPGSVIMNPAPFDVSNFPNDAEYGGRASYLFDFGLDFGVFFYSHWNRSPVYELGLVGTQPTFVPVVSRVQSIGESFSDAIGNLVLRGDGVININQPIQNADYSGATYGTEWQGIIGADYTTDDEWTFGAQYHVDAQPELDYYWASFRLQKKLFNDRLIPQIFLFKGINNQDIWFQPEITWNATSSLSASIRADLLNGTSDEGYVGPIADKSRFLTWLTYKF